MKCLAVKPGDKGVFFADIEEPRLQSDSQVKLRVLETGICGTDREQIAGGRCKKPDGADFLVLGHEMLGEVVETGAQVTLVEPGDLAIVTVRRGCGNCMPCNMGRPDMCRTGNYRERGIWGLHGYQCEYVVEDESYVIPLPPALRNVGVLCEPLSIVEKALTEAVRIQQTRLPEAGATPKWLYGRTCIVAGLGPIGLLAAMALRLRGAEVIGIDIVPADSPRPRLLAGLGGVYRDVSAIPPQEVGENLPAADLVLEAAGVPTLSFELIETLTPGAIHVLTGIPEKSRMIQLEAGALLQRIVLNNQLIFGSVNAAAGHFKMAVFDLQAALDRYPETVSGFVTHRWSPEEFVGSAMGDAGAGEIKAVVEWQ